MLTGLQPFGLSACLDPVLETSYLPYVLCPVAATFLKGLLLTPDPQKLRYTPTRYPIFVSSSYHKSLGRIVLSFFGRGWLYHVSPSPAKAEARLLEQQKNLSYLLLTLSLPHGAMGQKLTKSFSFVD